MRKVLLLVLCVALPLACTRRSREPVRPEGGELDVLLLSDRSEEVGPLRFDHRLHYALAMDGGQGIPCGTCHHDYRADSDEPPGACRSCHFSHDRERPDQKLPFL